MRRREGDAADCCSESSSESPSIDTDPVTWWDADCLPGDEDSRLRAPSEEDVLCRSERDAVISRLCLKGDDADARASPCSLLSLGDWDAVTPTLDPRDILEGD